MSKFNGFKIILKVILSKESFELAPKTIQEIKSHIYTLVKL